MAYSDFDDRSHWGHSKTSLDTLDEYWDKLLKRADKNDKEEIHYFLHCSSQNGKKGIQNSGCILGGKTDLPAKAPLASCLDVKGTWFALSDKELPRRSPYGTQRLRIKVKDMMAYIGRTDDTRDSDDTWDTAEVEESKPSSKKQQKGKPAKGKKKKSKVNQKECYLKNIQPKKDTSRFEMPSLFLECAHFYGNSQYVRLLLVQASDPWMEWCRQTCRELEIHNNPFFQLLHGRLYTYRRSPDGTGNVFIEVLVVGDIVLDELPSPPQWDVVGTMSRAGFDPRLGVYS